MADPREITEAKEKLTYAEKREEAHRQQFKEINLLLGKVQTKLGRRKKIFKPKEPVVFLKRSFGTVEVYEGIEGNSFIIPDLTNKEKPVEVGDSKHLLRGKRVAYLGPTSLRTMKWGGDDLKCYFIDEEDAMPWGANVTVWAETLEMTISAILINYRNLLERQQKQPKWLVDIIKYGVIGVLVYLAMKWLLFDDNTATQVATVSAEAIGPP